MFLFITVNTMTNIVTVHSEIIVLVCHTHKEYILYRYLLGKAWIDVLSCHLSQLLPNDNYITPPHHHTTDAPRITQLLSSGRPDASHNSVYTRSTTYTYTKSVHSE